MPHMPEYLPFLQFREYFSITSLNRFLVPLAYIFNALTMYIWPLNSVLELFCVYSILS